VYLLACGLALLLVIAWRQKLNRVQFENHGSVCPTVTLIKGRNGQPMAVSPFDGITRIRFKGSPACGVPTAESHPHSTF